MSDVLKDKFEETLNKIGAINKPISLIEDGNLKTEFVANGNKYVILPPDKVLKCL